MRSYSEALKILKKSNIKIHDEIIKSINSLNRVCSSNIYSKSNYPSENNTSLDGFALNFDYTKNTSSKNLKKFKIVATISAGSKPYKKILKKNEAIEIMTGGIMPKSTNTIIPFEECTITEDKKNKFITIKKAYKKFNNVRFKGSDYKIKDIVVKKNTIINSSHIMALKALGIENITVKKKNKCCFFFLWK